MDSVNRAIELERFLRRQIPPQRILLSHQQTKLPLHLVAPLPRDETEYPRVARGWIQQPGQHFQHRCFPGAVWPKKADKLPFLDLKTHSISCARLVVTPPHQALDRSAQSALLAIGAIDLG